MSKLWNGIYYDFEDADLEELDLYTEFEQMLEDIEEPKECRHKWIEVGTSPITNTIWINCEKCDISIEEYEETLEF